MKAQIISDTHGRHNDVHIEEVDMLIHCGDSTNWYELMPNEIEFRRFLEWFLAQDVKHKILIAGNHDAWATKKYNTDFIKSKGIIYLEHEEVEIGGIRIFGSPYTPTFGQWHFMKDRSKLDRYWSAMEKGIHIAVTHGPPKGILDLSRNKQNVLEFCGDNALYKHIERIAPIYHCFGHIHNFMDCVNNGIRKIKNTTFINASVVEDGKFDEPLKNKNIIIEL